MKILVDENIPLAADLFGTLGEMQLAPGRAITPDLPGLDRVEVMAIRSVTPITRELLLKTPRLRAIGTATIGTDHIDMAAVEEAARCHGHPIRVFSAPGSNADSVADYVFYAIFHLTQGQTLAGRSIGVVGVGNCGSRVARRAAALGMTVLPHDPPRAEAESGFRSLPIDEVVRADFVTFHVPLTRPGAGKHPTYHMINRELLAKMRRDSFLLNACRGAVADTADLVEVLRSRRIAGAVLDVYEGEPEPSAELIRLAAIATPHIAGYSIEGKRRGTIVIYRDICRALGLPERADAIGLMSKGLSAPRGVELPFPLCSDEGLTAEYALRALAAATHDIGACSEELKATLGKPDRGRLFDAMRRNYDRQYGRRDLSSYSVGIRIPPTRRAAGLPDTLCDPASNAEAPPALRRAIERCLDGFGVAVLRPGGGEPNFVLCPTVSQEPRPASGSERASGGG